MGLLTESGSDNANKKSVNESMSQKDRVISESVELFESKFEYRECRELGGMFESDKKSDQYKAALTIKMIENQERALDAARRRLGESVVSANLGQLNTQTLDIVRIFYPNQIAHELVDIQPMDQMTGQIFTMKPRFSNTFGGVNKGDEVFRNYPTNSNYASEEIYIDLDTGDGSTTTFNGVLSPAPVRPGSIKVTVADDASTLGKDNGVNGSTTGQILGTGIANGSINYEDGTISVEFSAAPANAKVIKVEFCYSHESNGDNIRKITFDMDMVPVKAKAHPLRLDYSVQSALAADAHFGVDVSDVLVTSSAAYIKQERDYKIINLIRSNASAISALNFDADASSLAYSKKDLYAEIEIKLNEAEMLIREANGRGGVDFVICGKNASTVFKYSRGFKDEPVMSPIGAYKVGSLRDGQVSVIYSPNMPSNEYVFGFKGYQFGDAATILAEWIPIYFTNELQQPGLVNERGLVSMYDLFVNNAGYYVKGSLSNYGA